MGIGSRGLSWPVLLVCFFLSGIASLVYQVAWTRQFALVFGSSEQAVAAVLAAFLGGLGLGAACAAFFSPRVSRPVLLYAFLELAVAVSALAVGSAIRLSEGLYVGLFGMQGALPPSGGAQITLFNLATAFAILGVPAACMGATLPMLARFGVRQHSEIGSATGVLYAINTAGAVLGAPLAAFVLLPSAGLAGTVIVAVGLNLMAFAASLVVALSVGPAKMDAASESQPQTPEEATRRDRILALLVICSGAVSLLYEVFWTRLLSHLLGGSLYAFSTMLASFLAGIALGSAVASRFARSTERGVTGFVVAQLGIAVCTAASYAAVVRYPNLTSLAWGSNRSLAADALLAATALLPAAICIGATFPFAVRVLARRARDAAPASARIYGWGTLGSIAGSITAGLFFLPALGFAATLGAAIATNLLLALAAALALGYRQLRLAAVAVIGLTLLALFPPTTPWSVLRSGPLYRQPLPGQVVYHAVGRNATVLLTEFEGWWRLSSNGLPEGSIQRPHMPMGGYQVTRWLGSLAVFARPDTRSIMVIGLGTGEALEAVPATIESIEVVELEPEVVRANQAVASQRRRDPLSDPRVRLVVNDARGALLLSRKTFDAIVSQPSHPWTSGSANLYTREFFELVRARLGPDGVLVQWIGLAFIDEALLRSILATLTDVFPHVVVHRPPTGAALLFLASESSLEMSPEIQRALAAAAELPELGIARKEDLAASLVLDETGARSLANGAPVIRDNRNLLEAHSQRTVGRALGRDLGDSVLAPWDPLLGNTAPTLDRACLIRRLLAGRHGARARRLAEATTDPGERQVAFALLATASGKNQIAAQLVADALSRNSLSPEGRALSLRLRHAQVARGGSADPRMMPLTPIEETLIGAWRLEGKGQWAQIEMFEPKLATVEPGDPLYRETIRMRAAWRLAAGGRTRAGDALRLIDALLARGSTPDDLLLRARAASAVGDPRSTLATLSDLAHMISRNPRRENWARPARVLLDHLREDPSLASWRLSLHSALK